MVTLPTLMICLSSKDIWDFFMNYMAVTYGYFGVDDVAFNPSAKTKDISNSGWRTR